MAITIEILNKIQPSLRWQPQEGTHTAEFLKRKRLEFHLENSDALDDVLIEAHTILGRCVPPNAKSGQETGLVIGYVQSGKTLSFTTVMALARDNRYQLIVLLAGIAVNLKNQSEKRLAQDLGLDGKSNPWVHFENPKVERDEHTSIQQTIDIWKSAQIPAHKRRTVLITVLKNHTHLKNLKKVLSKLKLEDVPSLIIDDEGDQASLNTKAYRNLQSGGSDTSTTYDAIVGLKAALPHHTLLQYTATPQANLLIGIADILSPSFAEFVTPGNGYVGGEYFFKLQPSVVQTIPANEIPGPSVTVSSVPPSLTSALRFFLLGAAAHVVFETTGNRSMLVHPSQKTDPHADYKRWVTDCLHSWKTYLNLPESDPTYQACAKQFQPEYLSLQATCPNIPQFDVLLKQVPSVFLLTGIVEVNSTRPGVKDVDWRKHDYWILVGGQKLDRGFTVEGLTVTYMPRGLGAANADTLQQRARFFGYKAEYAGYCRVFLQIDVRGAFEQYVKHEEFIRSVLTPFRGQPLANWKRDFILTQTLNPTRQNVIGMEIRPITMSEGWFTPGAVYRDPQAVAENRQLADETVTRWRKDYGEKAASSYPHFKDNRISSAKNLLLEEVRLQSVFDDFLFKFRVSDFGDSEDQTALLIILANYLKKHPDAVADVFLIGELTPQTRTLDAGGKINQVFSGKSPNSNDFNQLIYVGDRALHASERLALHVRYFNLNAPKGAAGDFVNVPWYAVFLPKPVADGVVIEEQGHWDARNK